METNPQPPADKEQQKPEVGPFPPRDGAAPEGPTSPVPAFITIEDFKKCQIKIGLITAAERVPETDKLVKLTVDCGEGRARTIVSGIAVHYPDPNVLVGKRVPVLANLAPRKMKGIESEGMILYAVGADSLTTLEPATEGCAGDAGAIKERGYREKGKEYNTLSAQGSTFQFRSEDSPLTKNS